MVARPCQRGRRLGALAGWEPGQSGRRVLVPDLLGHGVADPAHPFEVTQAVLRRAEIAVGQLVLAALIGEQRPQPPEDLPGAGWQVHLPLRAIGPLPVTVPGVTVPELPGRRGV